MGRKEGRGVFRKRMRSCGEFLNLSHKFLLIKLQFTLNFIIFICNVKLQ